MLWSPVRVVANVQPESEPPDTSWRDIAERQKAKGASQDFNRFGNQAAVKHTCSFSRSGLLQEQMSQDQGDSNAQVERGPY